VTAAKDLEIGGKLFRVQRLKPKEALRGLRMVGKVLLPAMGEAQNAPAGQIGDALTKVVEGLDCLPELLDLFAARTQVPSPTNPQAWVDLSRFIDETFQGCPEVMVQFLVEVTQLEFAGFFSTNSPLRAFMPQSPPKTPAV
jgi:hypothetical protein